MQNWNIFGGLLPFKNFLGGGGGVCLILLIFLG